jgi:DNA-binding GntR family transcriptional regulator
LQVDDADPSRSSVTVKVNTASIAVLDAQQTAMLKDSDFFDVARFPEMTYVSKRVERISEDALPELDRLVAEEAELVERRQAYEAAEVDLLFHRGVAEATGNSFLVDASTRLNVQALRIWYQMIVTEEMIAQEHADIVDALRDHDADGAVAAVDRHIRNAYRRYVHMTSHLDARAAG